VLNYLYGDHLGSSSVATDNFGVETSRRAYLPFGAESWSSAALPTDRGFTGQREEAGLGLYDYRARFYDPTIGRFISADTIVPDPANPQSLNRYSYVYNNPVRYTDPSGRMVADTFDGIHPFPLPGDEDGLDVGHWLRLQMISNARSSEIEIVRSKVEGVTDMPMVPLVPIGPWPSNAYPGTANLGSRAVGLNEFRKLVDYEGPYDFKTLFLEPGIKYVAIGDNYYRMDIVGNIHYGFVGRQAGISATELKVAAGVAQFFSGDRASSSLGAYGDDPVDQRAIELGIELYDMYGPVFGEDEFLTLMQDYTDRGWFDDYLVRPGVE